MAGHVRPNTLRRPGVIGPASPGILDASSSSAASSPAADLQSGTKKLMAPNKKQHEMDLKDISDKIAAKERDIMAKKQQFAADSGINTSRHAVLLEEIREANDHLLHASDALKTRNVEIEKKHDEVNQLRPKMTYRTESQIDETINRLEYERTHRNFTLPEEQKIIREIDKLRRSKNELRSYNKLVTDRKVMETSLKELRDRRQACYIGMQRLISEDKSLKETDRRHKEGLDIISREVMDLQHRKHQIVRDYENRVVEWEAHMASNRRWKHASEQQLRNNSRSTEDTAYETLVRDPFAGLKQVVASLLAYLQQYVKPDDGLASLPTPDGSVLPLASSTLPPISQILSAETPGYFLPKKHSVDVITPIRPGYAKGKKDKRKTKSIAHSAAVVAQFTSLDLLPPANTSEVPTAIESLKAKKLDLDKQTLAKFASMTPKTSPTDENLPPLAGTSSITTVEEKSDSMPSISVSSVDEVDSVNSPGQSAVEQSIPSVPTDQQNILQPDQTAVWDEKLLELHKVQCQLRDVSVLEKPSHPHLFTVESVSEFEGDSSAPSVSESTAENSADDEEAPPTLLLHSPQPTLSVQMGGGHGHTLNPLALTACPETPPIDEAFTKPKFSSLTVAEENAD